MDLTKIFSGMDKGPEAIQANFEKLNAASGSGTEWSKVGLISLNGFGGNNLCWRKYKAGGLTILEFSGWCTTPTVKQGQQVDIVKVSDDIKNLLGSYFAQTGYIDGSPASGLSFDQVNGKISMTNGYSFDLSPFGAMISLLIVG